MTRHTLLALALGSCTLGLLTTACKEQSNKAPSSETAPVVKVFHIRKQAVTDTGEWFGYLRGKRDTDISPRVSGFLIAQEYKNGQKVKEGDILFRIDPSLYEAELEQAKANLRVAEASLVSAEASQEQAQLDVARYQQLVKTSAISEKDLSDAEHKLRAAIANVDACKATVEQNKAAVSKAQINLDYTVIRAPYDGIVGTALASMGDLVSPGAKLANITSVDPIRVDFSINGDRLIDTFRKYGNIGGKVNDDTPPPPPFELRLEDGSTYPGKGELKAMESKLTEAGLIDVIGEIANPDSILRAGMPVRVRIPLEEKEALLVPREAIRSVLRNDFIIVVDKNNEPHMVPITQAGEYEIDVKEADGYASRQTLVAIKDVNTPLSELFRSFGYDNPEEVPIVTDAENGVRAMNISSANSRLSGKPGEERGKVTTAPYSFRATLSPALAAAAQKASQGKKAETPAPAASTPSLPPFLVKVAPLLRQDVTVMDEWFGTLRGIEETEIRPRVSGFILSQHFQDGALVKEGDVLFTIDPAPYKAALDEAKANLLAAHAAREQAQSRLDMSRQDYERYHKLSTSSPGAVSDKTVTDAATAVKTNEAELLKAEATIAQMEAAVHLAEINLGYTTITAPFDGRAGIHKPSLGALVSPEDKGPLVTLSSVNPMRVDFNVSGKGALSGFASFADRSHAGQKPDAPQFDILLEDGSLYPAKGRVISTDNALSTSTGTLRIVGQVDNMDGGLRSGMPVRVRAGLNAEKGAFLVPARAPLNAQGMDLIALLRPDNTPILLPISKGALVTIPVTGPDGSSTLQPMQIVDVNRGIVQALLLSRSGATSLEEAVLKGAHADSWKALLLQQAGVADTRVLLEQKQGQPLPDDAPAQAQAADWDDLLLKQSGADNFRTLVLRSADARDELDLIARQQGFSSLMEMALHEIGVEDPAQAPVIVEGSLMAAQVYQANEKSGGRANKLTPIPFQYRPPRTVVPSITADQDNSGSAGNNDQK